MDAQDVWIVHVIARESANSMRRQELVFIQHVTECMTQFVGIDDGEESSFAIPWGTHTGDVGCQVATVLDKPFEPAFEIGEPLQKFGFKGLNRKERDQADHGADLHRRAFAVWKVQHVIEESVYAVPHRVHSITAMAHGVCDVEEVFPELAGDVFIDRILAGELKGDGEHVECVHGHPGCPIGLFNMATSRKRCAAIKDADVVEAEKAALEYIHAFRVLAIYPPGEVEHEFLKHALKKGPIAFAASLFFNFVHAPCGPGVNGKIQITESPFVRGELTVGMHVPFAKEKN